MTVNECFVGVILMPLAHACLEVQFVVGGLKHFQQKVIVYLVLPYFFFTLLPST